MNGTPVYRELLRTLLWAGALLFGLFLLWHVLTPLIMQKVASVHPAVVIAAVTLLGTVFGFLGALLALPLAVVAEVLVEELWFQRLEEGSMED